MMTYRWTKILTNEKEFVNWEKYCVYNVHILYIWKFVLIGRLFAITIAYTLWTKPILYTNEMVYNIQIWIKLKEEFEPLDHKILA